MTYTREQEQQVLARLRRQEQITREMRRYGGADNDEPLRSAVLASVIAERDRLGEALYAAYVATGADTDGARDWESLFRPMTYPSWAEVVREEVECIRTDAEDDVSVARAERDRAVACIRAMEDKLTDGWAGHAVRAHGALHVLAEYDKEAGDGE